MAVMVMSMGHPVLGAFLALTGVIGEAILCVLASVRTGSSRGIRKV